MSDSDLYANQNFTSRDSTFEEFRSILFLSELQVEPLNEVRVTDWSCDLICPLVVFECEDTNGYPFALTLLPELSSWV